jgi:type VI secretion system secreted protein Hcp
MIFLDFGKLTIKGDSEYTDHVDMIKFDSVQWGVGRAVSGGGNDRKFSDPSFSEITLSKLMDKSSVDLFISAASLKTPHPAMISWCDIDDEAVQVYHQIELGNAVITSYSSQSGGDTPSDSITLNFTTMKVHFTRFPATGSP